MRWSAVLGSTIGRRQPFEATGPVSVDVAAARLARRVAAREVVVAPAPVAPGPLLVRAAGGVGGHRYGMAFEGWLDGIDGGTRLRGDVGLSPFGRFHLASFLAVAALLLGLGIVRVATDGSVGTLIVGLVAGGLAAVSAHFDARAASRLEAALAAAVAPEGFSARPGT